MDLPIRLVAAYAILGGIVVVGVPTLVVVARRRKQDRLRRRGIKSYNRGGETARN